MKRLLALLILPFPLAALKIYPPFYDSYTQCQPTPLVSTAGCRKVAYEKRSVYLPRKARYKATTTKTQPRRTAARIPR